MVTLRFDDTLPKIEKIGNVLVHRIGFTQHSPDMSDLKKFPLSLNKMLYQILAAYKASRLHAKYHYDGVWAIMAHSCGIPAGIFKTFHPKVKYLLTLQEGDPLDYIQNKMRPAYPLFIRGFTKADMIQAISTFLFKWAREMGFKGPAEIVPNAVDISHFSKEYAPGILFALKKRLGKKDEDIFLITTSRLVIKNAISDVIRALSILPKNIKFLILGIGPEETKLRALVKEKGLEERIIFLGQIPHEDMPAYLKISDIFIRPSLSEGMGNSFVEAMAAGLPVIATQEGGISDFLFDPELNPDKQSTGRAVKPSDYEDIARAVHLLLDDKKKTAEIRENAKKLVLEKYDWNIVAGDMRDKVFRKLFL
jgi:glycosyltransferase involved in cell wall biosynthesis